MESRVKKIEIGPHTLYCGDSEFVVPTIIRFDALVAAAMLGKKFTGIERERKYFDIACRRIEEATKQADLFIEQPKREKPEQWNLELK